MTRTCILRITCRMLISIVFIGGAYHFAYCFDPMLDVLPQHPRELIEHPETETLDSIALFLLEQWYSEPLNVPSGELRLLAELFPELGVHLPQPDDLERYLPWGPAEQGRFFEDYPVARNFLPVLTFLCHGLRNTGTVDFYLQRKNAASDGSSRVRFTVNNPGVLDAGGTIDITDEYARWDRRSFRYSPSGWCSITGGNRTLFYDGGLVYGYFRRDKLAVTDVSQNWRYAAVPGWNGVALELHPPGIRKNKTVSVQAFVHKRQPEAIAGGTVMYSGGDFISGSIGYTRLEVQSPIVDARQTLHSTVTCKLPSFTSELRTALSPGQLLLMPLQLTMRYKQGGSIMTLEGVNLPKGYDAPSSALLRRFVNEMDFTDDTLSSRVTSLRMTLRMPQQNSVRMTPAVQVWLKNGDVHHARMQMSTSRKFGPVDAALTGAYALGDELYNHGRIDLRGELFWCTFPLLTLTTQQRVQFTGTECDRYSFSLTPELLWGKNVVLEPSLKVITRKGSSPVVYAGCGQRLQLFGKMYTQFTFEQVATGGRWVPYRFEAVASFVY